MRYIICNQNNAYRFSYTYDSEVSQTEVENRIKRECGWPVGSYNIYKILNDDQLPIADDQIGDDPELMSWSPELNAFIDTPTTAEDFKIQILALLRSSDCCVLPDYRSTTATPTGLTDSEKDSIRTYRLSLRDLIAATDAPDVDIDTLVIPNYPLT